MRLFSSDFVLHTSSFSPPALSETKLAGAPNFSSAKHTQSFSEHATGDIKLLCKLLKVQCSWGTKAGGAGGEEGEGERATARFNTVKELAGESSKKRRGGYKNDSSGIQ